MFRSNHRSVFAQHNAPRHNPSPPPMSVYSNSPHMHSRTPSISGAPSGPRHGVPGTSAGHHPGTPTASGLILQPNPYAQVDPPGSNAPPSGALGMRPSPHLHTSHVAQPRDIPRQNEHAQAQNANLSYSNPQTPIEHPSHQPPRGRPSSRHLHNDNMLPRRSPSHGYHPSCFRHFLFCDHPLEHQQILKTSSFV